MSSIRTTRLILTSLTAALLAVLVPATLTSADTQSWTMGGHDYANSRSNPAQTAISPGNARLLATKWTFTTHGDVSATPAVVGKAVYFPDWGGYLNKVDATTGTLVWQKKLSDYGYNDDPTLVSRTSPAVVGDVVYIGDQGGGSFLTPRPARLLAINANTGELLWSSVINPSIYSIITQSPIVRNGVIYVGAASAEENVAAFIPGYECCTFRGSFSAVDAASGQVIWTTYTVPEGYSGGAVWGSTPAIDAKTGAVYITTGNNYSVPPAVKQCQLDGGSPAQCLDPSDHVDAVMALDPATGLVKWSTGVQGFDDWIVSCIVGVPNCPVAAGPDFDFGSGPNLFSATTNGKKRDLVGAGAKSGIYWALDATTGEIVWSTQAGPGSTLGGIEWGTATDGKRIYVAEANWNRQPYPNGSTLPAYGSFAALDPASGQVLWQVPDPSADSPLGAVSVSNGVLYGGSMSGHMYAFDAATGAILKDLVGEGSSNAGPAISNQGVVYWGNGYGRFGLGTPSTTFYAFSIKGK
ncbi:polyvinylalcohol dehydrogenase [Intrasporangium oryzae NRRL B-24470]|uniref:Polyvinylalcohol dehydrogenase n=1 Tax=Intrasporangium oryzae NRRL B-24470 TaxID=1386089 RepID=W9GAH2_9MICO|nr:PQQ-binding-like beta-propeller repeat protein [Intrasporangium oryzae]EWT03181.1 polyvinylalcohol dehydrogenase [Intrasporangium oryzae NRRL B-24470]